MSDSILEQSGIAIIGMAGRFPGASNPQELWSIVRDGRDMISRFAPSELAPNEPDPSVLTQANYVRARGLLDGAELFDADFFDYSPGEASHIDPQHRIWLEVAWEALESAGYAHDRHDQIVSVFAGAFTNNYLLHSLLPDRAAVEEYVRARRPTSFALMIQNDAGYLPTRTAHRLNLRGPAINIQTACSTSLVAIAMGVQNLLAFESDIAIAGGVCVAIPQKTGYFYQEGAILSRDGVCRPYDKQACGTVFGNGAAVVVMKRYEDAKRDGDPVLAIIRSAATNNDGRNKVSYVAPSVQGQARAIVSALGLAGVSPESIGYVEGHGTATPLGDPIEVEALTQAFRTETKKKGFCCLGSLKGNIGHLDAAAGASGLIRAVLALTHGELPPTAHYQEPNPALRLGDSPFFILREAQPWPRGSEPRRAGVSSFGVGGTNCHVILEEAPALESQWTPTTRETDVVLTLSARSQPALDAATAELATWLARPAEQGQTPWPIGAVGSVLRHRRQSFEHRRTVRVRHWQDAVEALRTPTRQVTGRTLPHGFQVVLLLPGQGSLRTGSIRALVADHRLLGNTLEPLARLASDLLHFDLWRWFNDAGADESTIREDNARYQMAIFCLDTAVARWLEVHGISPSALLGHSLGELVALHLAGVLSTEHALRAVYERGSLMQSTGPGAALIVSLSEQDVQRYLDDSVTLACVNSPKMTLLSGRPEAIAHCAKRLSEAGVSVRTAPIDIAVHSRCMDAVVEPLAAKLRSLEWRPPSKRMLSAVTGDWLDPTSACDPDFWARQMRAQVRFSAAAQALATSGPFIAVEVGLGSALSSLLRPHLTDANTQKTLPLLSNSPEGEPIDVSLIRSLERLWVLGAQPNFGDDTQTRYPLLPSLPTYAFQRRRFFVDPPPLRAAPAGALGKNIPPAEVLASPNQDTATTLGGPEGALSTGGSSPLDDAALRLLRLFEKTLGIDGMAFTESFLERGGNSMLAVVLLSEVERAFGVPVSLPAFFLDPTPRGVRATLEQSGAQCIQGASHVFRSGGDRVPVFFICGIAIYRELAERLDPRHPAFALFVQSEVELLNAAKNGSPIRSSVDQIAREYFERVTAERPQGPYALVGVSFGGLLALRVAEMLRALGQEVELVALLDTLPPTLVKLTPLQRASFLAQRVMREGPGYLVPRVRGVLERRLRIPYARPPAEVATFSEAASTEARELEDIREGLYSEMASEFAPQPYSGRTALLISKERDRSAVTARAVERYWRQIIRGPLYFASVAGGHVSMLANPYVDELAVRLQEALDG